ncbi:hypothetical protein AAFF_G00389810 [Aldrovandia affinis]|uniref:Uncharacterized protein n=1 Tax=Aldrovandia affinis TaxID=143900 RepID=A0AAD7WM18_9TELE|nr:hypothetical protein AAFF_G00389810 [Aldrovandia affinis]
MRACVRVAATHPWTVSGSPNCHSGSADHHRAPADVREAQGNSPVIVAQGHSDVLVNGLSGALWSCARRSRQPALRPLMRGAGLGGGCVCSKVLIYETARRAAGPRSHPESRNHGASVNRREGIRPYQRSESACAHLYALKVRFALC